MRVKLLSFIAGFLLISVSMSSCLGDDTPIEYSSNALIQAFALEDVLDKNYVFTIDQLRGQIYNQDSMPVGSDTIIDKILITTFNVSGVVTMRNHDDTADTIFNYSDSINFVGTMEKPLELKVWAPDGVYQKTYSISVRVHQQQPDSLDWGSAPIATDYAPGITGKQKSIIYNNQVFLYADGHPVYYTAVSDGRTWYNNTVSGLPSTNVTSIVNYMNTLYATVEGSTKSYASTDGISWSESSLGDNIVTFISPISNILTAIKTVDGTDVNGAAVTEERFCTTDGTTWVVGDTVPQDFPQNNISATVYKNVIGIENLVVVGNKKYTSENDTTTVPWAYMEGQEWVALSTESSKACPKFEDPSIIYYGDSFYIFGNSFTAFYNSVAGLVWNEIEEEFLFPEEIRGKESDYSMVVDDQNRIWIMRDTPNEVWRGKLNRLGFLVQ